MGLKVNQQHNLEQLFDKFATIDPKNRKETKTVEKESNKKNPTEPPRWQSAGVFHFASCILAQICYTGGTKVRFRAG